MTDWKPISTAPVDKIVLIALWSHEISKWKYLCAKNVQGKWTCGDGELWNVPHFWAEITDPHCQMSRVLSLCSFMVNYGLQADDSHAIAKAYDESGKLGPAIIKAYELLDDEEDTEHDYAGEVADVLRDWENRYGSDFNRKAT